MGLGRACKIVHFSAVDVCRHICVLYMNKYVCIRIYVYVRALASSHLITNYSFLAPKWVPSHQRDPEAYGSLLFLEHPNHMQVALNFDVLLVVMISTVLTFMIIAYMGIALIGVVVLLLVKWQNLARVLASSSVSTRELQSRPQHVHTQPKEWTLF